MPASPTSDEAKVAHALGLAVDLEALKAKVEAADGSPWFGGLPPLYEQTKTNAAFLAQQLRDKYEPLAAQLGVTIPTQPE